MIEQKGRPLYDFLIVKATPYLREQRAKVRAWKYNLPTLCQLCYNVMDYAIYVVV